MNYSTEEIFQQFGQYDRFVVMDFHRDSESYRLRPTLMGTFVYSHDDRARLQKIIEEPITTRSDGRIRFEPSPVEKLTLEQISDLDKHGIMCSDMRMISYVNLPVQNTFTQKGEKELNQIIVPFSSKGVDPLRLRLGLLRTRMKIGYSLTSQEEYEYQALELFFSRAEGEEADIFSRSHPSIRYHYLNAKYYSEQFLDGEEEEYFNLIKERVEHRTDILFKEIDAAGLSILELIKDKELYGGLLGKVYFDDELLVPYELPIWWDYERFLHVYIRHVKELQPGKYAAEKTKFQYKLKDIPEVVKAVLEQIYPEILKHFKDNPDKPFFRIGKRMPYYNGNYYRVDIEPGGRLVAFHPYNDNEEK